MTKREQIRAQIAEKKEAINAIEQQIEALYFQDILLSDEVQQYEEKEEEITTRAGKGKSFKETVLVGRIRWKEKFYDDDYPGDESHAITIERSRVVRVGGEWV